MNAKHHYMKTIAVICGGYSGEYEISVQSAHMVQKNLNPLKYNSYVIYIEKDGWFYYDELKNKFEINSNDFSLTIDGKKITFDGVFNAIHGTPGEDGKILGYFDMLNIPYTSSGSDVSSLTFNKYHCNNFVRSLGLNLANSISFTIDEKYNSHDIIATLGLPVFVKPARSGSSVGVTKVKSSEELESAIDMAFKVDSRVIIEEFLEGREIDCGLLKYKEQLIILPLTEIVSNNEFFDYEAKYTAGKADEITPPVALDSEFELEIKATSSLLYNKLECKGIVRVDYILTSDALYFIEINTVPGLSAASIVPKQAEVMDIPISRLFEMTIENMFN